MRFQKGLHVIAILAIVTASGCVQEPKRVDVSRDAKTGSKTLLYQKEFPQDKPSLENFQEGVFFELSEHVEDFFTQDIAEKVQNNMDHC
ncbi:hypothetical protein [Paenibacillus cineris]|uniref:hypothetical protein n=1 Tax=Paenibacillus cineris TaxID=237530 RepID=UPI001B187664|nr:hypothetical protein [Paenibacillus cineris]GIO64224.1 hypothetical protein J43TS9_57980 [Paenibacillus cineris]